MKGKTILLVFFSAVEVGTAQEAGEVSLKQPGVVVNMPLVVWDGGKR
jgi:hypothetical protein